MKILVLSNSAPNYHNFFNYLVEKLEADGNQVEIAIDCSYTRSMNGVDALGVEVHQFSDFWMNFKEDPITVLDSYYGSLSTKVFLPDFERAYTFGFAGKREEGFYNSLLAALIRFYEKIFTESKIELVLYENVSNTFAYVAWFVAMRMKITYCGLVASRLPGRFSIVNDPLKESLGYEVIFNKIRSGSLKISKEINEWSSHYIENIESITPDYMKFNKLDKMGLIALYAKREKFHRFLTAWKHRNDPHVFSFQVGNPLSLCFKMFKRSALRRLRSSICKSYFSNEVNGDRFFLYPLHFHPESSTSVNARNYIDEYEVVKNIAFNLPAGLMLYVKDHVSAYAYQKLSFYKKISELPNVKVLSPAAPTKELIKKSLAVITLTSTVGYEALLLNKKVFLFGSVFYEFHKNVVKLMGYDEIFDKILQNLEGPVMSDDNYNRDFVASYYCGTYEGSLNFFLNKSESKKLVDNVYEDLVGEFNKSINSTCK